jgi:hypothetical protein
MSKSKQCTKGWNWGHYELEKENFEFKVNGQPCFSIPYTQIGLSSASGNNEVTFEFQDTQMQESKKPNQ